MVYPTKDYTVSTGTQTPAPKPVISSRNPTAFDIKFALGTPWINKTTAACWTLGSTAGGAATWTVTATGLVTVPQGGTGQVALTNFGVVLGQGAGAVAVTAAGTSGQLLIGSTGANPAFATATSTSSTITFTPGAGSLNIDVATSFMAQTAVVTLTAAQVRALRATPITVIAAPAAGKVIHLLSAQLKLAYGGTNAFTNPQDLVLRLVGTAGAILSGTITAAGFLDQAASMYQSCSAAAAPGIATAANTEAQPLVIHNTGGSEITGNAANDNTLKVIVQYQVLTM